MTYLKRTIIALTSLLLISIVILESFYLYKLNDIQLEKIVSDSKYPQKVLDVYWATAGEKSEMIITPTSATQFIYYITKQFITQTPIRNNSVLPSGSKLSGQVARYLLIDKKYKNWHLTNIITSIWVSNNYSAKEAISFLLSKNYYGHEITSYNEAAKYYFQKKSEKLNLSEIVTLIAITHSPTYYDPYCKKTKLIRKSTYINEYLTKLWPSKYGESSYAFPVSLTTRTIKCKNI